MCGRFVQRYTWDDIQDLYDLPDGPPRNLPAHYNIAPTDPVEVVRPAAGGAVELVSMRSRSLPVVLDKADIGPWLSGEAGIELLRPAGKDRLRMWGIKAGQQDGSG